MGPFYYHKMTSKRANVENGIKRVHRFSNKHLARTKYSEALNWKLKINSNVKISMNIHYFILYGDSWNNIVMTRCVSNQKCFTNKEETFSWKHTFANDKFEYYLKFISKALFWADCESSLIYKKKGTYFWFKWLSWNSQWLHK